MTLLTDRSIYPDERYICPTIISESRRKQDGDKEWLKDIPKETYTGCHVVLTVEPGGERYSISFVTAEDESMRVKSVLRFKS